MKIGWRMSDQVQKVIERARWSHAMPPSSISSEIDCRVPDGKDREMLLICVCNKHNWSLTDISEAVKAPRVMKRWSAKYRHMKRGQYWYGDKRNRLYFVAIFESGKWFSGNEEIDDPTHFCELEPTPMVPEQDAWVKLKQQ